PTASTSGSRTPPDPWSYPQRQCLSTDLRRRAPLAPSPGMLDAMTAPTLDKPPSAITAPQRYNSAVATIQIREIPEEAYEVLRKLARAEGKSLQSYMRDRMIEMARQAEKEAAFAA